MNAVADKVVDEPPCVTTTDAVRRWSSASALTFIEQTSLVDVQPAATLPEQDKLYEHVRATPIVRDEVLGDLVNNPAFADTELKAMKMRTKMSASAAGTTAARRARASG